MRTVWILNHYAQEPGGPGGTRHYSLARHLHQLGWLACIIAGSIELNTGRQRLADGEVRRLGDYGGVPFLWLRVPAHAGNGVGRMFNMLTYALRALLPDQMRGLPRPDVIIGSSVHPFAAWAGERLARRLRVPFVFEVRDLWPQTLIDLGRIRADSMTTRMLRAIELHLYRRAERILVLMPRAAEYIEPLGIPSTRILWLPNGVDIESFPCHDYPSRSDASFTLMYFGAHGNANGLGNVVRAMAILRARGIAPLPRVRLIGDGPLKPELQREVDEQRLDMVSFEDPVKKSDIPELAAQADAFLFNLVDSPVFRFGISSNKLFDFMAAARPIIFSCGATNNPVADARAGITVRPDDPDALADAIIALMRMPIAERAELGANARRYVEDNHDYRVLAQKLAGVLDELAGSNRKA